MGMVGMSASSGVRKLKEAARIILVGAPGVGKGTQSERLMRRYPQLASISTGDLLRDNVRDKTPLGLQAESFMKSGSLVPDPLILDLILKELTMRNWLSTLTPTENIIATLEKGKGPASANVEPSDDPASSFILDGFPRTATQADSLSRLLPMNLILHLVTPVNIILSRMATRWIHAPSGRVYNIGFNDPKIAGLDDITGEKLTQREDDSEETWRRRLAKFDETSTGLLDFYKQKQPSSVVVVRGNSSDEISPQIFQEIEQRFA